MTDPKENLIHILNQCQFNKSFRDSRKLSNFIDKVSKDNVRFHKVIAHDDYLSVSLWTDNDELLLVSLFDDNHIILVLPCGCDHRLFNDSQNMQYDEIRALLLSE